MSDARIIREKKLAIIGFVCSWIAGAAFGCGIMQLATRPSPPQVEFRYPASMGNVDWANDAGIEPEVKLPRDKFKENWPKEPPHFTCIVEWELTVGSYFGSACLKESGIAYNGDAKTDPNLFWQQLWEYAPSAPGGVI